MRDCRDLEVWQKSMVLVKQAYLLCATLPKEEIYGLVSQIRRAAVSILANIAEGAERNGTGAFIQFLGVARGSAAELETLLLLTGEVGVAPPEATLLLRDQLASVRRMLSALMRSLRLKR